MYLRGPLLFVIFINDIEKCFKHSKFLLFADDMKMFKTINSLSDAQLMQEDLLRVVEYCNVNRLDLNISKCQVLSYSRKKNLLKFDYSIANTSLTRADTTVDLGVHLDNQLSYSHHIDRIVGKATAALGFIIRNSKSFSTMKSLKILYCAFVRSHLEYASQIWNPNYAIHASRLERIQRKFTRFLLQVQNSCHGV